MEKITCKVCSSRYQLTSERRTWRNTNQEVCKCGVCRTVLKEWTGSGVVPVLQLVWRSWGR
jgi:hypothetical protein